MILKQIELSGFRGVRGSLVVPFAPGFTVITGRNGAGKSTVCDGLEFVLTGTLNRFSAADVESGEHISDYLWCRESPPRARRDVCATFLLQDGSEISRGLGEDAKFTGSKDEAFYDAATCPPDPLPRICLTSVIRDELITKLSIDMTETDRFDFVNKAIGTTNLASLERRAIFISKQIASMQSDLERQYTSARDKVTDLVTQLSEARVLAATISTTDVDAIRRRLRQLAATNTEDTQSLAAAVDARAREVRARLAELDRLKITLTTLERQSRELTGLRAESEALQSQLSDLDAQLQLASEEFALASERLKAAQNQAPIDASLAQLREHGMRVGLRDGRCPLCGSEISDHDYQEHLQRLEQRLAERGRTLAELAQRQAEASTRLSANKRDFESKSAEFSRCQIDLQTITKSLATAQSAAEALEVDLNENAVDGSSQKARALLAELEQGREVLLATLTVGRIADLEQSKLEAETHANELSSRISQIRTAGQNAKAAGDSFKRVAWEIIDERLAALSPLLSEMYVRLHPHLAYSDISYRMRGDVKRFLSFSVGKEINPRFTFSSGQRRALGLAFLMSVYLARPWCRLNTLLLDDPVQHIDDYRALHLVETLSAIRQLRKQIVCTVEDPALAELLCRRLRATVLGEGLLLELQYDPDKGTTIHRQREIGPLPHAMLASA